MTRVSILIVVVVSCCGIGFDCADAKMRHNRRCDVAQEKPGNLNPGGGNAIMFGLCSGINDAPTGEDVSRAQFWNAYNCGYQAYREGKTFGANPFRNDELADRWNGGWKDARKACAIGKGPFDRGFGASHL